MFRDVVMLTIRELGVAGSLRQYRDRSRLRRCPRFLGDKQASTVAQGISADVAVAVRYTDRRIARFDRSVKKGLPGMTFTVSATSTGVQFWVGMSNPTSIVEFNWQDVDRIGTGSVPAGPRELPAISLQVKTNGPENLALTFALGQEGFLNVLPRGRGSVEEVARSLEDMRAFAGSTRLG